jgi:GNAT superfamily N-acetyltransferase
VIFSIRTTREDDWPLVRDLRIENATDNPIAWTATREETLSMAEEAWKMRARRGEMPDTTSIVAIESGTNRWLGMMNAQTGDEYGTDPVLTGVYVTPDARGREHGVADALLEAVVQWATSRANTLRLHVYEHAEPARRFYVRNGFAPTGRTQPMQVRGRQPQSTDGVVLEFRRALTSAPR